MSQPTKEISPYENELLALGFVREIDDNDWKDEAIYKKSIQGYEVIIRFQTCISINGCAMIEQLKSKRGVANTIMKAVNCYDKISKRNNLVNSKNSIF